MRREWLAQAQRAGQPPYRHARRPRQYLALLNVIVDGKRLSLGCFHSAEEAALMVARKLAQIEREKQAQATLAQRQQQAQ